jgi:hypothetical protein
MAQARAAVRVRPLQHALCCAAPRPRAQQEQQARHWLVGHSRAFAQQVRWQQHAPAVVRCGHPPAVVGVAVPACELGRSAYVFACQALIMCCNLHLRAVVGVPRVAGKLSGTPSCGSGAGVARTVCDLWRRVGLALQRDGV